MESPVDESKLTFDEELDRLYGKVARFERFIHLLAQTVPQPFLMKDEYQQGFRYGDPRFIHFCILRGARIVSVLYASIDLARVGFPQEIGVLLRTMIEYVSHIDYMLASLTPELKLTGKAARFLEDYFKDSKRGQSGHERRFKLPQEDVHKLVGRRLDEAARAAGIEMDGRRPMHELMSNVYMIFSNFVHGRYPESMDLYGGRPGRFHMGGMRNTPKDAENLEILRVFVLSASNCFKGIVIDLKLHQLMTLDPELIAWMADDY